MTTKRKSKPKNTKPTLTLYTEEGESREQTLARNSLRPTLQAALTVKEYVPSTLGEQSLDALILELSTQAKATIKGDLSRGEIMLTTQAHTLDAIFNTLAQRAARNMNAGYTQATEQYLRLALKAQSQCRTTWEAISAIQNPPIAGYVKQANISHGPQQVNNGAVLANEPTRTRENENEQNKLLEEHHGERLEFGTQGTPSRADPAMATLDKINGAKDDGR